MKAPVDKKFEVRIRPCVKFLSPRPTVAAGLVQCSDITNDQLSFSEETCSDITNTRVGISGETVPEGRNLCIY